MLSVFPTLLAYQVIGATLLRIALGAVFLVLGYRAFGSEKSRLISFCHSLRIPLGYFWVILFALVEILTGIFLLAGLYTQIAAIVAIVISLKLLILNSFGKNLTSQAPSFYFLTMIIATSLLFLGPGLLAFDLPL